MPFSRTIWSTILSCGWTLLLCACGAAQTTAPPSANPQEEQLRQLLTGATLIGHFTDDATPAANDQLAAERYEISSIERMGDSDLWLIQARIQYGDKDMRVPVPVVIKWAGKTPVITLDQVAIPGLGTFDARVLLTKNRYAGTWQHDQHGGHLFGRIEHAKTPAAENDSPATADGDDAS